MTQESMAMVRTGKTAIKSYPDAATMVSQFEQSIQYLDQVFYVIDVNKFYRFLGTYNTNINDYVEINLIGASDLRAIPQWDPTVNYIAGDIIAHAGDLYTVTTDTPGAAGNISPNTIGAPFRLLLQPADNIPPKIPDYVSTYSYSNGDICARDGFIWVSLSDGNLGNIPDPASNSWMEYKQHFFLTADNLSIARSMGYFIDFSTDPVGTAPQILTQTQFDSFVLAAALRWNSHWKVFHWQ